VNTLGFNLYEPIKDTLIEKEKHGSQKEQKKNKKSNSRAQSEDRR
jgi:hypothetical protein